MAEAKDPKIKLFGKTIELPETSIEATTETGGVGSAQSLDGGGENSSLHDPPSSSNSVLEDRNLNGDTEEQESLKDKDVSDKKKDDSRKEDQSQPLISEEPKDSEVARPLSENSQPPSSGIDATAGKTSQAEEDQSETSNSQEKTLKKPDKILPCPRCNSMDTKFCYFNNYNVNQPRHFCKNCQRYWTAGGTMRNVPVGAGRRKNKNAASNFRHLNVSESLQNAPVQNQNGLITFQSDTPLCESMASVSIIADRTTRNGFHKPQVAGTAIPDGSKGNGNDQSCGSSVTGPTLKEEVGKTRFPESPVPYCHSFPPQVPCFPGGPWPYPWNSVQWSPASFPMPFYPTPSYWGCPVPGTWNVPWVVPPTASQNLTHPSSGPNSPTLGKHSRDENTTKPVGGEEDEAQKESNPEKCLWVPKTLRIDDPGDAAKSSIWATLGIKNDTVDSIGSGTGLFKAFKSQSVDDGKTQAPGTSTVLQANPAAFSRSLNFHENS